MIMIRQFHIDLHLFIIFNKRKLDENEIIRWYLLTKLKNNNEKAYFIYLYLSLFIINCEIKKE